eukprot:scaffold2664_cov319-Prasinococcus_capsulatus_cf.AAC.2
MDWNPSMTALQPFDKNIAHTRGVRGGVSLVLASPRPRCQDASRKRCEVTQFVSLEASQGYQMRRRRPDTCLSLARYDLSVASPHIALECRSVLSNGLGGAYPQDGMDVSLPRSALRATALELVHHRK